MGKSIRISNGKETFEVDSADVQSAAKDGFYPTQRFIVANPKTKESYEIEPADAKAAFKDGFIFSDIINGQKKSRSETTTQPSNNGAEVATQPSVDGSLLPLQSPSADSAAKANDTIPTVTLDQKDVVADIPTPDLKEGNKVNSFYSDAVSDIDPNYEKYTKAIEVLPKENNIEVAKTIADSKAKYEAFTDKVVGRYNPITNSYEYKSDELPKEGDIVAGDRNGKGLPDMGGSKFAQLREGKWQPIEPPDPLFGYHELEPATVVGYNSLMKPKYIRELEGTLGKDVRMDMNQLITPTDYKKSVDQQFKDEPLTKEYFLYHKDNDKGGALPFFVKDHPEIATQLNEQIKETPTQLESGNGRFELLNKAVTKAYELDKNPWTPLGPDQLVDSPKFHSMLEKLEALDGQIKTETERQTVSGKPNPKLETLAAESQDVVDFFSDPKNQRVLDLMQKQDKGLKLLSGLHQFFPKMTKEEQDAFETQHKETGVVDAAIAPFKSLLGGVKGALVNIGQTAANAVIGTGDLISGGDGGANREFNSWVNETKGQDAVAYGVKHYDEDSKAGLAGNMVNEIMSFTGRMAPTVMSGGSGLAARSGRALIFGVDAYQNGVTQAKEAGVKSNADAQKYGLFQGTLMGILGFGLKSPAEMEGFKPSADVAMKMVNPETRELAAKELVGEINKHRIEKGFEVLSGAAKGAAEMQAIAAATAVYHQQLNTNQGTKLPEDMPGVADFIRNTVSFGLQQVGMRAVVGKGEGLKRPEVQDALVLRAQSKDLTGTLAYLDQLAKEPNADLASIQQTKDRIQKAAGYNLPKGLTPEQQLQASKIIDQISAINESVKGADNVFKEAAAVKRKAAEEQLHEIVSNPELAKAETDKAVLPVEEEMAAAVSGEDVDSKFKPKAEEPKDEAPNLQVVQNGDKFVVVDGIGRGKKSYETFDTKEQADNYIKQQNSITENGGTKTAVSEPLSQDAGTANQQGNQSTVSTGTAPMVEGTTSGTVSVDGASTPTTEQPIVSKPIKSVEDATIGIEDKTIKDVGLKRDKDGYSGDFLNDYDFLAEGSEHGVYKSKDGSHVIKIGEPYNSKSNSSFIARVKDALSINKLLGDGSLEVVGYYKSENGTKNPVYRQNFIEGKSLTQAEVADHLKLKGFTKTGDDTFTIERDGKTYEISDTSDNFIKDKNGNVYAIDAGIVETPTPPKADNTVVGENTQNKINEEKTTNSTDIKNNTELSKKTSNEEGQQNSIDTGGGHTGVRNVANDEATVLQSKEQEVQKLRRERDNSIRRMENELQEISSRYGAEAKPDSYSRKDRERRELLQRELQVGYSERAKQEQENNIEGDVSRGSSNSARLSRGDRSSDGDNNEQSGKGVERRKGGNNSNENNVKGSGERNAVSELGERDGNRSEGIAEQDKQGTNAGRSSNDAAIEGESKGGEKPKKQSVLDRKIEEVSVDDILNEILGVRGDADISNGVLQKGGKEGIDAYTAKAKGVLESLYPKAKLEVFETRKEYEAAGGGEGSRGFAIMGKNGEHKILLNLEQIREDNSGKTAFHEVIHPIVYDAFTAQPEKLIPIWNEVATTMQNVPGMEKVFEHTAFYGKDKVAAEGITETLTQIAAGNISLKDVPKSTANKIIDLVNRMFEAVGISYRIKDVNDFGRVAELVKQAFETSKGEGLKDVVKGKNIDKFIADYEKLTAREIDPEHLKKLHELLKSKVESEVKEGKLTAEESQKIYDKAGVKEPPPPSKPKETSEEPVGGRLNDKGILNRLFNAKNIPEETKKGLESEGLKYKVVSVEEAKTLANSVIDEFGMDEAVLLAEANKFKGGANSAIFAESLTRLANQESKAKTPQEKLDLAKKSAEFLIRYDELSRAKGQDISYINEFYKKSPLGVQIRENIKRKEEFDKWSKPKDQSWEEAFDELMKEPEFNDVVIGKVKEGMKQERAEARKERIKKVDSFFDDAIKTFKSSGATYSTIVPPKVITTALEGMKKAYHAGEKVAELIENAVDYISKELGNATWDKDKFRKEWETKLEKNKEKGANESDSFHEKRMEYLNKELSRIRKRKKKEPKEKKESTREIPDDEKAILEEIEKEQTLWDNEKDAARKFANDYQKMETERNRQLKRVGELNEKIDTLRGGNLPESTPFEPKKDTPEIEALKQEKDNLERIVRQSIAHENKMGRLETELQRLKDRKEKEPKPESQRVIGADERLVRDEIEAERKAWAIEENVIRLRTELQSVKDRQNKEATPSAKRELSLEEKDLTDQIKKEKEVWSKEVEPERKLREALKATQKSLEEYERRILEKDTSKKENEFEIVSPELKALRDARDAKRKEYEAMKKEMTKPSDAELDANAKSKYLDNLRKKLVGLTDRQKEDVILKSHNKIIESGGLDFKDFRDIIAQVTGRGEMSDAEAIQLKKLVAETNAVDDAGKAARELRTPEAREKFREAEIKAGKAARELSALLYNRANVAKRLTSMLQLNTLGVVSLVNNVAYNVINHIGSRVPIGLVKTGTDKAIYAVSKAIGKEILPETNVLAREVQQEFFSKLGLGVREAVGQFLTGLNRMDYTQKEIQGDQIRPYTALTELWEYSQGKRNLTKAQITDKALQASPQGWTAEGIARLLNLGDKPMRFAAEGVQAAAFAKNLGLKGIDYDLFIDFPREEAYRAYKEQGLSDAEAGKKADYIRDTIVKEGERSTFQQDNFLNDKLALLFGGKSSGIGGLVKSTVISPYIKIPSNAFWSYFNTINPEVAMLQSVIYGAKAAMKRGKDTTFSFDKNNSSAAKDLHEAKYWFAHGVVGFATRAVITSLVTAGIFRPSNTADDTKKEREGEQNFEAQGTVNVSKLWEYMKGGDPSKVKDGLLIQNKWFGQFGNIGNSIARREEEMTPEQKLNRDDYWNEVVGNIKQSALPELENGVFGNASSLLTAANMGGSFMQSWGVNTLNMYANIIHPAAFAQISKNQLSYYTKTRADDFKTELKNAMLTRSSWLRKLTDKYPPSKVSIWGEKIPKEGGVIQRMFGVSRSNDDNFAQPIYEDYKRTNNTKFFPPAVMPVISNGREKIKLNVEESARLEELVGQQRKNLLAPYVNNMARFEGDNKPYKSLSDDQKIKKLEIIYEIGFDRGMELFFNENKQYKSKSRTDRELEKKAEESENNEDLRVDLKKKAGIRQ